MFGTMEFCQANHQPRLTNWARVAANHLDSLDQPVTARDLTLLETAAATHKVSWIHDDRMRVCELLAGVRDGYRQVSIDGQAALLAEVRRRVHA